LIIPRREVDKFTEGAAADAGKVLDLARKLEIRKAADREFAEGALAEIARKHDAWDGKRLAWVKPLKAVAADIDASFRPATRALKEAIDVIKRKIGEWDVAQAQERARLLRASVQAASAGDQAAAAKAYEKAEAHVVDQGTATSKIVWTGEVADASLIPREYLVPDVEKLEALTRSLGRDPQIPGWRAYETAEVRTSRRGAIP
jgi:hypothetical protein